MRIADLITLLRTALSGLADLFLPDVCAACGGADVSAGALCTDCNVKLLSLVALPYCQRCGTTLGPNVPPYEDGCAGCPTVLPRFARVFRLGPYADPLRGAIRQLKYYRHHGLPGRLARLLAQGIAAATDSRAFDLVLPVPMHWRRRILRGTNHAAALAATVARELAIPLGVELVRVRNTPPQTHLSRTQRIKNMRGAFSVADRPSVRGAKILLIDDVTTTGATANEAARTLLQAGASAVSLAVIAKAESPTAYGQQWQQAAV